MPTDYLDHPVKSLVDNIRIIRKSKLWLQVVIGLLLGVFVGIALGPDYNLVTVETSNMITTWLALPGQIFLRLIKMIIIPLIFSSIIMGIISSGKPEFLKKIGPRLLLYFLITTTVASLLGFLVVSLFQPGSYIDATNLEPTEPVLLSNDQETLDLSHLPDRIVEILPDNPFQSIINGDLLGVVIFTIIFGVALLFVNIKYRKPTSRVLRAVQDSTMKIVGWAMLIAPFAVFGLITRVTSQLGFQAFLGMGMYILTVLIGLILMVIVYMLIVFFLGGMSPFAFLKAVAPVQLLAFSTSSSAAVMPYSMKTAEKKLKVKPEISRFLIPVGATINMDGTALYQVVATIFLAQVFDIHIGFVGLIGLIALTVGASIGAPAAPGIGIVILATILDSVGIPGAGLALILGVDRILDMSRTAVNVTGDLTACTVFNRRMSRAFGS